MAHSTSRTTRFNRAPERMRPLGGIDGAAEECRIEGAVARGGFFHLVAMSMSYRSDIYGDI